MWLRVLGSAAGGGFPQWNCACPGCRAARDGTRPCRPRTQSSIAVSADRRRWSVLNASPDLRVQIESFPDLRPRGGRDTPLREVLLTDAELDHTLGLLLLREGGGLHLHTTAAVRATLQQGTGLLPLLEAYCPVWWHEVVAEEEIPLAEGLWCRAFNVATSKPPRFAGESRDGRVIGYQVRDEATSGALVYLPGVQALTETTVKSISDCDCLLIDGTFWDDDELVRAGMAARTAHEMGHVPIWGRSGSLETISELPIAQKIYVHMNNTNPILLEDSAQRHTLERAGVGVATDGLEIRI